MVTSKNAEYTSYCYEYRKNVLRISHWSRGAITKSGYYESVWHDFQPSPKVLELLCDMLSDRTKKVYKYSNYRVYDDGWSITVKRLAMRRNY